jgi:hypothetical protein
MTRSGLNQNGQSGRISAKPLRANTKRIDSRKQILFKPGVKFIAVTPVQIPA